MVLAAVPAQTAQAASSYTEKLNVYVAGSDALWFFTFGGVNASSGLSNFENTFGLSWYNITAIKTTGWSSDFQLFGPRGYNLLPVPFVPSQGLFLTVGSDNFSDARSAAAALDPYLFTSFASLSNGTGTFSFYSPISFDNLVPATLLKSLPSGEGGFAGAISTSAFLSGASPFVVLEGRKSSAAFTHSLVVGSIATGALSAAGQPAFTSYFGGSVSSLSASNKSASSVVHFSFIDGMVQSTDKGATVTSDNGRLTGSYTLDLTGGKKVSKINATVVQQPAPLLAYRTVSEGVLKTGGNLTVTLNLKNLSPSDTITKIAFSDNWWTSRNDFKLLVGNYSFTQSLASGAASTPDYELQYTGGVAGSVMIPASVVHYQYAFNGETFNATTVLNPVRLSLGADDAVVYATVAPTGGFGKSVGVTQNLSVTVTNVGTQSALLVVVAGHSLAGLAAGASRTVAVSQTAAGLLQTNLTELYSATYQDSAGNKFSATSNEITDIFSHTSMNMGSPTLTVSAQVASLANLQTNLTLKFLTSNNGMANVTSFKATGTLPTWIGCGTISGTGIACDNATGTVTISYDRLNKSSSVTAYMKFNLTSPLDFILEPFTLRWADPLGSPTGGSNPTAVPAGLVLSKQFVPAQLFGGMTSKVTVSAANAGPLPLYNVTVASTADSSFDSVASGATLSNFTATVAAGKTSVVSYGVRLLQVSGTQTGTSPTTSFYLGGTAFSFQGLAPKLVVYLPLLVSIGTNPSVPEEGRNFTITIVIENPTALAVSGVRFTLPIPSGLQLSNPVNASLSSGTLTVSAGTLPAHGSLIATVGAIAGSGITIPFRDAKLTFAYEGVTINGTVPRSSGIAIAEDVTMRYIIPTVFILIAVLAVAFYVRKKAATAPASPK